ncbi:MAG: glutamine--fructose-6-phosphate transaminase (isomerizing) [bacterium]
MCGIIGYTGSNNSSILSLLINGLKRLEYRGYDSAGVTVLKDNKIWIKKTKGKINTLEKQICEESISSKVGIGHTRWATHGEPSQINAHPHLDCKNNIALVHNGIIENYKRLKSELISDGHTFVSDTDSEVLVHLIEHFYENDLELAIRTALQVVEGTFGIVVLSSYTPDKIFAARRSSPLVIGLGDGESLVASDGSALVEHTRKVIYLEDDELAVIDSDNVSIKTLQNHTVTRAVEKLPFDLKNIQKDGYPHFMLKEIDEQSHTILDSMRGRVMLEDGTAKLGGLDGWWDRIVKSKRFIITACGTSWHSALIGKYLIERLARVPVEVAYGSEFRYRDPILSENDTVVVVSQSGETADTLAAVKEAKNKGALTLGICNVVGSSIARQTDAGIYLHAGPEIGVASTKAFTSQVIVLTLFALSLGRRGHLSAEAGLKIAQELMEIPQKIKRILQGKEKIKEIASELVENENALYLGRGFNYPVALEGALKMKEISYIHAEGYPAAEMKHGPIALIDEKMPVIFIAVKDPVYEKIISNIEEVKARGGWVIAVINEEDNDVSKIADRVIRISKVQQSLSPVLTVIPLQLLAYYTAVFKGCDVDQPRNLAKSVTVE